MSFFSKIFGPSFDELAQKEMQLRKEYAAKHGEIVNVNIDDLKLGNEVLKQNQKVSNHNNSIAKITKYAAILLCFLLVVLVIFEVYKNYMYDKYSVGISLDEFNLIESGMSYEDVVGIIGQHGALQSSLDLDIGSVYVTELYSWKGTNSVSSASITFQGGKVVLKSQFNLK